jgi:hypothetical protein
LSEIRRKENENERKKKRRKTNKLSQMLDKANFIKILQM